jgi:hypothetical protein
MDQIREFCRKMCHGFYQGRCKMVMYEYQQMVSLDHHVAENSHLGGEKAVREDPHSTFLLFHTCNNPTGTPYL